MYATYVKLRDAKGVRDSDVAKATGIFPSVFTEWKNKKSTPKVDKLIKIADYFEISLDELVREQES
jgi:transcriptional regulator with XRE-family HTH domain